MAEYSRTEASFTAEFLFLATELRQQMPWITDHTVYDIALSLNC